MRHEACGVRHNVPPVIEPVEMRRDKLRAHPAAADTTHRQLGVVFLNGVVGLSLQTQPAGITFSDYTQPQSAKRFVSGKLKVLKLKGDVEACGMM